MATNDGMKMGAMAPWNLGRGNEACRLEGQCGATVNGISKRAKIASPERVVET
jgi:hypothetical protein